MTFELAMYFLLSLGVMTAMFLWHKKKSEKSEDMATSDFSNVTMFFDPLKGEGHLFVGGIIALVLFSLFLLELARELANFF